VKLLISKYLKYLSLWGDFTVRITVLGDANVDIIVKTDNFPRKGMKIKAENIEIRIGGSAANTAIATARLEAKTWFIGKIGKDIHGSFLKNKFIKENVNIESLAIDENKKTGIMIFFISNSGKRAIIGYRGANRNLKPEDVKEEIIIGSDILHISAYTLLDKFPKMAALRALNLASKNNILASLDAGLHDVTLNKMIKKTLEKVDIFFCNEQEIQEITNTKNIEHALKEIRNLGPKVIVLKLGAKGCLIEKEEAKVHIPAFNVQVLDVIGAGDVFNAGFLVKYIESRDVLKAGVFGNAVAALTISKIKARIPTKKEVENFLKTKKLAKIKWI